MLAKIRLGTGWTFQEAEFKAHGENNQEDSVMEAVVKSRNGSILGKHSILKMYFFPGQKTTSDHVPINGAPHVCKVSVGIGDSFEKCMEGF